MGRPADTYNAFRMRVLPAFHSALDALVGGYALSDTPSEEYVGTLHCAEPEVEELLASVGFSRNLVASLKIRVDGNISDGSWVSRDSLLADHQLHAILHDGDGGVDVYAHWEYSSIRHPYRHYLARDYDAETGVRLTRSILSDTAAEHDISWTIESRHRRHAWYFDLLRTVSEDLASRVADVQERFLGGLTSESDGIVQRAVSALR
ncbi:hypothetical protein [Halorubrum sp. DTA46]|uniref:hypothetical protein n=1 Tax=Halorubrum sp. DTA46 TaxID=3402162 RepID=UPI003AB0E352